MAAATSTENAEKVDTEVVIKAPDTAPAVDVLQNGTSKPELQADANAPASGSKPIATPVTAERPSLRSPNNPRQLLFSFRNLSFFNGHQAVLSPKVEHEKKEKAREASKRASFPQRRSEKHARDSAVAIRTVISGHGADSAKRVTKPQMKKIKSQLMRPKSANLIIAQLRALPSPDGHLVGESVNEESIRKSRGIEGPDVKPRGSEVVGVSGTGEVKAAKPSPPVRAVCLPGTELEMEALHFSKLSSTAVESAIPGAAPATPNAAPTTPSVVSSTLGTLLPLFNDLHVINFLMAPDFGLGQPGDGEGILAGALPTAETIINGVMQITPQLMEFGYATGKAILPDHKGVYPPLDRMSILTYWWGLEIAMPEPTMAYLDKAKSISHAAINLLTALSLVTEGVREILPFIRYFSQFLDFEWSAIKQQDRGKGVVCAATWIMPAAMVPRPWDFAKPPAQKPSAPPGVDGSAVAVNLPDTKSKAAKLPAEPSKPGVDGNTVTVSLPDTTSKSAKLPAEPSTPPVVGGNAVAANLHDTKSKASA